MKKILCLTLAVMMVLGIAGYVFAEGFFSREPGMRVSILAIAPAAANTAKTLNTTIVSGNSVFGFTVSDSAAGWVALYDAALAASASTSNLFGESRVAAGSVETVMFPFPKKISNGLVVEMIASTTSVMIYYE